MKRRTLLALGTGSAALLALAGGAAVWLQPARAGERFGASAAAVWSAASQAVLGPLLPPAGMVRQQALVAQLMRLQDTIAGLPPAMQREVDQLTAVLASAPGRVALAGLTTGWSDASTAQVTQALQGMADSALPLRQQAFHAMRELCNAAWFADADHWTAVGYPGPRPV